jgi:hypothetical protein
VQRLHRSRLQPLTLATDCRMLAWLLLPPAAPHGVEEGRSEAVAADVGSDRPLCSLGFGLGMVESSPPTSPPTSPPSSADMRRGVWQWFENSMSSSELRPGTYCRSPDVEHDTTRARPAGR